MHELTSARHAFVEPKDADGFKKNMTAHYLNLCKLEYALPRLSLNDYGITACFIDLKFKADGLESEMLSGDELLYHTDHYQASPDYTAFLSDVEHYYAAHRFAFAGDSAKGGFSCVHH